MLRDKPLSTGEIYHIYNRGAHKEKIFTSDSDYQRFLLLLYLANSKAPIEMKNLLAKYGGRTSVFALHKILENVPVEKSLVNIFSYALMPNHFHLVLQQKCEGGITMFMRKLSNGYTMYYNVKREHSGVLFQGRFKSKHIDNDPYFQYIFAYTHLNPLELSEPNWKEGRFTNIDRARKFLKKYSYSSYPDYCAGERPERLILSYTAAPDFIKGRNDFADLLRWMEYGGRTSVFGETAAKKA